MDINLYKIVAFSWAGVNLGITIGFVMGSIFFFYINKYLSFNDVTQVDHLKNALLSFALIMTKSNDVDNLNMKYDSYDGTKLPQFSGYSMENVYLTYIEKNPCNMNIYYKIPDNKQQAIQKYLDKNLDTQSKMIEFFDAFCKKISEKTEEPKKNDDYEKPVMDDDDDLSDVISEKIKEPKKNDDYEKPVMDDDDLSDVISEEQCSPELRLWTKLFD